MPASGRNATTLVICTLVIGGSFYLGILFYSIYQPQTDYTASASLKIFRPQLEEASNKDLRIETEDKTVTIKSSEIKKWLEPYVRNYSGETDLRISSKKVAQYLESLAPRLNSDPINAKLTFKDARAEIFVPSLQGKKLNISRSTAIITEALLNHSPSTSLEFDKIEPDITLDKINDLGIKTLLGKGESDYGKSPSSRIHNLKVGMSKFNGIILKPGEEFSFDKILGTVEESDGYQAELVIKNGKLERELGGGLCQVSTTVFRAAIMSGLPITERKPHSFPVQYYNPQGFDSTIYPGVVDLRFINNTQNHILVQTKVVGSKLSVEIYGSDDGRKVVVEGPIQYDKKPNGALKAYFVRKIYNGEQLATEERFDSVYKAPPPHEINPLE